jgi:type IV fimbrial biogenesis protein FimT
MHSNSIKGNSTAGGFTLLELMAAITLLGILLGVGVPSFNAMIRNNRAAAGANDFLTALSITRSEAMKRGMPVTICAADAAGTDCSGEDTSEWVNGWLVFSDRGGDSGVIDTDEGDEVVQRFAALGGGLSLSTAEVGFLTFRADGALASAPVEFGLEHDHCTGENRRVIAIVPTGRANLSKEACE